MYTETYNKTKYALFDNDEFSHYKAQPIFQLRHLLNQNTLLIIRLVIYYNRQLSSAGFLLFNKKWTIINFLLSFCHHF